jgi:alkaline phosphatase
VRRRLTLLVAAAVALAIAWFSGLGERRPGVRIERLPVAAFGDFVAPAPPPLADGPVERVVLLVGDGLGLAQLAAARLHAHGPEGRLRLERLPVSGLVATHPEGALVSKSDAAATALASGTKTRNGRVGVDGAGRPLRSLAEALHEAGGAVGLITTSTLADATPAAFGAHSERRGDTARIAGQLVANGFELMLGGGRGDFDLAAARDRGYRVIERAAELPGGELPLLGLFAHGKLPIGGKDPSLEQMARAALARLGAGGRRFFLLVEEEGIDSAGHARRLADLAAALVAFDAAVGAAVDFAARDGRTLVLVTADHATGALAIDAASTAERLVVRWSSDGHTGEPVPLFAYGPGAGRFAGLSDNTELARRIASLLGVEIGARP